MARLPVKERFLSNIPAELHSTVRAEADFKFAFSLWKLDDAQIKTLFSSIPDKLKPLFDWKLNKPVGKRGNRSILPYPTDTIKIANELLKGHPGAIVIAEGGITGTLLTVQVLAKVDVGGGKIKTFSVTGIEKVESKK